jgi:FkbM family methyltransferase
MSVQAWRGAKDAVQRIFNRLGYQIVRRPEIEDVAASDIMAIALEYCVLKHGRGTVLQVGANDGLRADPVQSLVKRYRLPAVLVEPLPDMFNLLCQNYRGYDNVEFENVAISTQPGEALLYRVSPSFKSLPDWVHGTATFNKSQLLKNGKAWGVDTTDFARSIETVRVPVQTIADIRMRHASLGGLMVLQIDTEGHDFEVIKSAAAAGCLPRLINYEHRHLSWQDKVDCRKLLSELGYVLLSRGGDTLALKRLPGDDFLAS